MSNISVHHFKLESKKEKNEGALWVNFLGGGKLSGSSKQMVTSARLGYISLYYILISPPCDPSFPPPQKNPDSFQYFKEKNNICVYGHASYIGGMDLVDLLHFHTVHLVCHTISSLKWILLLQVWCHLNEKLMHFARI